MTDLSLPPPHGGGSSREICIFGPFELSLSERILQRGLKRVTVGSRAMDLLIALVEQAGDIVSGRELIARVWPDLVVGESSLRFHIAMLRKALGDERRYIANVVGRGYSFVAPIERKMARAVHAELPLMTTTQATPLPPVLARMVGRAEAVQAIRELLEARRFVTIAGPGGMGKTTVAVSVAHALSKDFDDEVHFVDLSAQNDASLVASSVAGALGIASPAGDAVHTLVNFLAERRLLLVLDNCEHVIEAVAVMLKRLFTDAPRVHLLATSREALRIEGEHVHLLQPLVSPPVDCELTAAMALSSSAVQLFMDRAAASGYASPLTDAEAPVVANICRRLDGIALAIELAGSQVGAYGISGTADLLQQRFGLLFQGRRTDLPRHQTLDAMLEWSYSLLSELDQKVFRRLSVFVGIFNLETAQFVAEDGEICPADVAKSIASLVDRSLLTPTPGDGEGHYRLLEMTRTYAAAKLSILGEEREVSARHAFAYAEIAKIGPTDEPALSKADLFRLAPYVGNFRAALEWSFSKDGDPKLAVKLAKRCTHLFSGLSLLVECYQWSEKGLSALTEEDRGGPTELFLRGALAVYAMFASHRVDVRREIEDGVKLARSVADDAHELQLLGALHLFLLRDADFRESLSVAERAKSVAHSAAAKVRADCMLGVSYHLIGDQAAARTYSESARIHSQMLEREQLVLYGHDYYLVCRFVSARALWLSGFPVRAVTVAHEAMAETEHGNSPIDVCVGLYCASVLIWNGDLDEAAVCLERLVRVATQYALFSYQVLGEALLGTIAIGRGDIRLGLDIVRRALAQMEAAKYHIFSISLKLTIGFALTQCGDTKGALAITDAALEQARERGGTFDLSSLYHARGEIILLMTPSDEEAAEEAFLLAVEAAKSQSALMLELKAVVSLAALWVSRGWLRQAREMVAGVYNRFTEGFDNRDLKAAKRMLDHLVELERAS